MNVIRRRWLPAALAASVCLAGGSASAQSADNVLLVVNRASKESAQIGEYYARKRSIPQDQVLALTSDAKDEISREQFERDIEAPIATWLIQHFAQDRILYIVLTKGVPLRVAGTTGTNGTMASVDSELALLYRKLTGRASPAAGPITNPYYLGAAPITDLRPFTHEKHDIFLVTRLDAFTVDDVFALIDRGLAPARTGRILLDGKSQWVGDNGNAWLERAAERLATAGFKESVVLDTTKKVLRDEAHVLGYYSWGSNDPAIRERRLGLSFEPGAIAGMFVSSDGRTFAEPPPDWRVGDWTEPRTFFKGSPQSLAADLIRDGVTGVAGHVAEPFLEATVRPDILFPAYVHGLNLAEAFYSAIPYVSWQTVVIGDPLCAPFRARALRATELERGIDPDTELPAAFSAHRLRVYSDGGVKPDAARRVLRGEARLAKNDAAGARRLLQQATEMDEGLITAHFTLALLQTQAKEYPRAIESYQKIIVRAPDNVIALNNLADLLAVQGSDAKQALPIAEKAYALSNKAPLVADTLAWVCHLLGDDTRAGRLLFEAIRALPQNADLRVHAAMVYAASGRLGESRVELRRALELNPDAAKRDDVKTLQQKLGIS